MIRKMMRRYRVYPGEETMINLSCVLGVALFVRIVYFFGFTRLEEAGFFAIAVGLVLPLLLETAFIVLLRGVRYHKSDVYLCLSTAMCLVLFLLCFRYVGILRAILGFVSYLACIAAIFAMLSNMLSEKIVKWIFFGVALGRLLIFNLFQNVLGLHLITFMFETAGILDIVAMGMLVGSLKKKK